MVREYPDGNKSKLATTRMDEVEEEHGPFD